MCLNTAKLKEKNKKQEKNKKSQKGLSQVAISDILQMQYIC